LGAIGAQYIGFGIWVAVVDGRPGLGLAFVAYAIANGGFIWDLLTQRMR
jgi:hypothetical protein